MYIVSNGEDGANVLTMDEAFHMVFIKSIRSIVIRFFFIFGLIFCVFSVLFLQMGLNINLIILFSLSYGLLFCIPFALSDKLLPKLKRGNRRYSLRKDKKTKLWSISIIDSLFIVASVLTIQAIASNGIKLPIVAVIGSMSFVSVLLIVSFSLIFYFWVPLVSKSEEP
jgi:hypothetical protein